MGRRSGAAEIHRHKPKDIRPQGTGSGLDADTLRGKTDTEIGGSGIQSNPPAGKKKITNYYWDPDTKELVVETE